MVIRNSTNDPVEYEQNGSPPPEEGLESAVEKGTLEPFKETEFAAKGDPPFQVRFFRPKDKPNHRAEVSVPIDDVRVVLNGFPEVSGI